jgi:transposase-like protein
MTTYSDDFKASIVAKLLPPRSLSVVQLVKETGIPRDTLYGGRRQAAGQRALPPVPAGVAATLSSAAKFAAVVETATRNELDLGAYCRHKGPFTKQLAAWRQCCVTANEPLPTRAERAKQRAAQEQIKDLSKQLQRKDRALAEAAVLLVRQKKSA